MQSSPNVNKILDSTLGLTRESTLESNNLKDFLDSKGNEYAPFDPNRAKTIFNILKPHLSLPKTIIHLIGTNGKGSTGRFITLGLESQNLKVFHFTSPHIFTFNERFYKNGNLISDEELQSAHEFLMQFSEVKRASYFEYATFLAFYLAQDCDYLVLEAGLGGEFDSTSVVDSTLSVFTPISMDHTEILGETIDEIATTKLNAMSKLNLIANQPFSEVVEIAKQIAESKNAILKFATNENLNDEANFIDYVNKYSLEGFLKENLKVALLALDLLGIKVDFSNFKALNLFGRASKFKDNILIDVGHNEGAAFALSNILGNKRVVFVYNAFFQKNVKEILSILKPNIKKLLIIEVQNERILNKTELESLCFELGIPFSDFEIAKFKPKRESKIVVFGSFSVVKEFYEKYTSSR